MKLMEKKLGFFLSELVYQLHNICGLKKTIALIGSKPVYAVFAWQEIHQFIQRNRHQKSFFFIMHAEVTDGFHLKLK